VKGLSSARYRFTVAQGFLQEARQDVTLQRWRSAVDNAQLAVENAAKTALVGPVGRTHNPAVQLRQLLEEGVFPAEWQARVRQLAERAELLGPDVHIQTDYGDEVEGRTPWDIFQQTDARQALTLAEEAVALSKSMLAEVQDGE
jgi:HEPN domain-containing protein